MKFRVKVMEVLKPGEVGKPCVFVDEVMEAEHSTHALSKVGRMLCRQQGFDALEKAYFADAVGGFND